MGPEVDHHLLLAPAEHDRVRERGHARDDLDGPAAGVVVDAVVVGPAVDVPDPGRDGAVDDRGPEEHEDDEGQQPAALGDGAGDDGARDGGELHLVQAVEQLRDERAAGAGHAEGVLEAEVPEVTDEAVRGRDAEGERVAPEVPLERDHRHGRHAGEDHAEGRLPPGQARVEEAEPGYHDQDHGGGDEDEGDVALLVPLVQVLDGWRTVSVVVVTARASGRAKRAGGLQESPPLSESVPLNSLGAPIQAYDIFAYLGRRPGSPEAYVDEKEEREYYRGRNGARAKETRRRPEDETRRRDRMTEGGRRRGEGGGGDGRCMKGKKLGRKTEMKKKKEKGKRKGSWRVGAQSTALLCPRRRSSALLLLSSLGTRRRLSIVELSWCCVSFRWGELFPFGFRTPRTSVHPYRLSLGWMTV